MKPATFRIGDYLIAVEHDASLNLFFGSVVNKRYPIRLSATTSEELCAKFKRLLTSYLGGPGCLIKRGRPAVPVKKAEREKIAARGPPS